MKFKGQTLRAKNKEYTLKQQLTEGGFSTIYSTNVPQVICKAQVLSVPQIAQAYQKEKQVLSQFESHANIVKLHEALQMKIGDNSYGFLLMENCSRGTAHTQLQSTEGSLTQKDILRIFAAVIDALESLHNKGICHRDIKLENVLRNQKGQYKLCDFGSCTKQVIIHVNNGNRVQIEEFIQKTTTPFYRSPQQLDLYSGYEIGPKVDIFAVGVLIFMLCFKKPPFQSRLSAINKQCFIPDDCVYSTELLSLIQRCWISNPRLRPSAKDIKQQLSKLSSRKKALVELEYGKQVSRTVDELSRVNNKSFQNIHKEQKVETSFFDRIKLIYTQYTTETEGWIRGFMEDNQEAPPLKYNRFIISKCWEKRYKIEKVYQIIWNYAEENQSKCLVILKLLILIHNFLRKGPTEASQYDKEFSPIRLATKLYKNWKLVERPTSEIDIKRNVFVCLLIRYYCLLIIGKAKFAYENSDLFEGNYSIVPFFSKKHEITLLRLPILESMLQFLETCADFHEIVQNKSYILEIQRSIILSMVDQEYCMVSTFVFVYAAFKHGVSYVQEELDLSKLEKKLQEIDNRFQKVYLKLISLFQVTQKFASLFENNTFLLNKSVINHLKNIKVTNKKTGNFKLTEYLNYKDNIGGLKLPLTYEEVIKNPNFLKDLTNQQNKNLNKDHIEVEQYKIKREKSQNLKVQASKHKTNSPIINSPAKTDTISHNYSVIPGQQKYASITSFEEFGMIGKSTQDQKKPWLNQNASFQKKQEKKNLTQQAQKQFNTMEFTHQNLNRDFMTNDFSVNKESDKFKDFMSIVDMKVEQKSKKTGSIFQKKVGGSQSEIKILSQKQNFDSQNSNRQTRAKEDKNIIESVDLINGPTDIYLSAASQKPQIKKMDIINFFEDDEEQSPTVNKKEIHQIKSQSQIKSNRTPVKKSANFEPNFDLQKVEMLNKTDTFPTKNLQNQELRQIKSEKDVKTEDNCFIDLKGFIVEEVRRNAEQYLIDFKSLKLYEKVGNGHSSQVYRGEWRGRQVAIKKIKDSSMKSSNAEKEFRRQIMTSVKIRNHPQLVTLIGVAEYKDQYYIINEFCYGLTLFDLLHESTVILPWKIRVSIAKQIARGILFLHTNEPPIIHRDLKSLNVLLANKYESGSHDIQIKIADFGLSRDFASTYMTGTLGTYHWMAPQIFNNEPYSLKADVYSYGIMLWQIASRTPPYRNMLNPQALMKFVTIENGRPDLTALDPKTPIEIRMLMMRCWDRFPSNRPDFSQILNVLNSVNI